MIPEVLNYNGVRYTLVKTYNDANKASKDLLFPIESSISIFHVKDINQYAIVAHAVGKMPEDGADTLPRLFALIGFSKSEIKYLHPDMLQSMNIYTLDFGTTSQSIVASVVEGAKALREPAQKVSGDPLADE